MLQHRIFEMNIIERGVRMEICNPPQTTSNIIISDVTGDINIYLISDPDRIECELRSGIQSAKDEEIDQSDVYLTALEDKRAQLRDIYNEYATLLLGRLWEESMLEKGILAVTDEEIAAYYDKYPYEMTIKQLIIPDAQTADAVWRELKRSKSRWKELERQYSKAPEQSKGQEITFMPGEFIPELEVIAANSPTGSVQGFVKTAQGFHIIMKTRERRLSLKDAAPRIRAILEKQKEDAALNALQNKYKVVIYEQDE